MSENNINNRVIGYNIFNEDNMPDPDQYNHQIKLELNKFNFTENKCDSCDGVGYFYLSDHRLFQCEKCNGEGRM